MAEEEKDDSQKTEEPSEKKLEDARKEGQIATSKEVTTWLILFTSAIILVGMGPSMMLDIKGLITPFLVSPHDISMNGVTLTHLFSKLVGHILIILAIPFVLFCFTALFSGLSQSKFNFSLKSIQPKLERISLGKGFGRLFSMKSLIEMIKSIIKIAIVTGVCIIILWPLIKNAAMLQRLKVIDSMSIMKSIALKIFAGILSVMAIVVILDYLYQRFSMMKQLRMTKQEVKDEYKQTVGNPEIRQRLRQIRLERSRQRMMAAVPGATVVITNPTHYSIALKYDPDTMNAPLVVAKGIDDVALRIREVARENGVLLFENKPLARILYDTVEIDQEVPVEHYQAVAEVIRFVMAQSSY